MAKLITETSKDILTESKGDNMYVVGIFSSFGRKNNNNRVYPEDILKREVQKIEEKVSGKKLWGELGHPPNPEINPQNIAIRVEGLEWKGKDLYGKAKILDTPMGKIAHTLVREGNLGISSRGLGTVSESGNVNEDYNLLTWDLVTDPSNDPSWVNGIYEAKEFNISTQLEEKIEEELSRKDAEKEYVKHIWQVISKITSEI